MCLYDQRSQALLKTLLGIRKHADGSLASMNIVIRYGYRICKGQKNMQSTLTTKVT